MVRPICPAPAITKRLMTIRVIFQDKILGLLNKTGPNSESQADDGTPWYFKYGSRALGIVGAFCTWRFFYRQNMMILYVYLSSLHSIRLVELLGDSTGANDESDIGHRSNLRRIYSSCDRSSLLLYVHWSCSTTVGQSGGATSMEPRSILLRVLFNKNWLNQLSKTWHILGSPSSLWFFTPVWGASSLAA